MIDWNHLKKANTDYFTHLIFAVGYSFLGLGIFVMGILHALFPFMFGFTPYKIAKIITTGTEKNFNRGEEID